MKMHLIRTLILCTTLSAAEASAQSFAAVDGDTVKAPYGVTYRLQGYDTPETFHARCPEELALGLRAKEHLETLLAHGEVRILEAGKLDKYGRTLATLTINGRDVAAIMVEAGLARAYHGGKRLGWCGAVP